MKCPPILHVLRTRACPQANVLSKNACLHAALIDVLACPRPVHLLGAGMYIVHTSVPNSPWNCYETLTMQAKCKARAVTNCTSHFHLLAHNLDDKGFPSISVHLFVSITV